MGPWAECAAATEGRQRSSLSELTYFVCDCGGCEEVVQGKEGISL
jgi:hypothetical protein